MGNEKRRITQHAGRFDRRTKRVFGRRHNGRETTANAPHIDSNLSVNNIYKQWKDTIIDENGNERKIGFEECEKLFYKERFSDGLEARNERYRNQGHSERCKTTDDLLTGRKTAPDEEIVQLGNKDHSVDAETLMDVYNAYLEWHQKRFKNVEFVDLALHVDEPDMAPHIHARKVFIGHDKDENEIPNQSSALEEMGIERPNLNEPTSRYNNAKMTYTKMCRDKILEICREHNIEFEEIPKEASKSGLAFTEYKFRKVEAKLQEAEQKLNIKEEKINALNFELQEKSKENESLKTELKSNRSVLQQQKTIIENQKESIQELKTEQDSNRNILKNQKMIIEDKQKEIQKNATTIKNQKEMIKQITAERDAIANELNYVMHELEEVRKENEMLQKEKSELQTEVTDLKMSVEKLTNTEYGNESIIRRQEIEIERNNKRMERDKGKKRKGEVIISTSKQEWYENEIDRLERKVQDYEYNQRVSVEGIGASERYAIKEHMLDEREKELEHKYATIDHELQVKNRQLDRLIDEARCNGFNQGFKECEAKLLETAKSTVTVPNAFKVCKTVLDEMKKGVELAQEYDASDRR